MYQQGYLIQFVQLKESSLLKTPKTLPWYPKDPHTYSAIPKKLVFLRHLLMSQYLDKFNFGLTYNVIWRCLSESQILNITNQATGGV